MHTFDLPLKHTFTISRDSHDTQRTLIVELFDGEHRGFGEATANNYYNVTIDLLTEAVDSVLHQLEHANPDDPATLWECLRPKLQDCPFALCAIDQAAYDLWGKRQAAPVYSLWGLNTDNVPDSNFTIAIDSIDAMIAKLAEEPNWPIYKIKLGTDNDLDIVHALRQQTPARFRVDANCGWTAEETIANSEIMKSLGVEFIEQPLPADAWADAQRVHAASALPIIADESCLVETDVDRCAGAFHGINIKLPKCGGLTPARRMIERARELGLSVMCGCMTESTVGISAIGQILPLLDYVDMDGAALLAQDIASGVEVRDGVCHYPSVNGNGVTLLDD